MLAVLAVVVPALALAALAARRSPALMAPPPTSLTGDTLELHRVLSTREGLFPGFDLVARVLADSVPVSRLAVELHPIRDPERPDLLVYWAPGRGDSTLPVDATLLGALDGTRPRRLPLPPAALATDGTLILYSPASGRALAVASLPIQGLLRGAQP